MIIDLLKNNNELITILISLGAFFISVIAVILSFLGYRISKKTLEENLKLEVFQKYDYIFSNSVNSYGEIQKILLSTIQVKIMNIGQQPVKISSIIFVVNKRSFSKCYFSHNKQGPKLALPGLDDFYIEPHEQRIAYLPAEDVLKMQPDLEKYTVQVKITSEINNVFLSKKVQLTPKQMSTDPNIENIIRMAKPRSE